MNAPSTAISGEWLPLKKAVSISTPATLPLAVPSRITTQSAGSGLWRRVSHPSYQAPVCTNTPGLRIGGVGVRRFSAAANHSSLKERTFEPRGAEMRSGRGYQRQFVRIGECHCVPVYCDLKVESIWSAGIWRAAEVAMLFTSSGSKLRISMMVGSFRMYNCFSCNKDTSGIYWMRKETLEAMAGCQ
jgi:hypothetical protein